MMQPSRLWSVPLDANPPSLVAGAARQPLLQDAANWLASAPRAYISIEGALRNGFADEGWWAAVTIRDGRPCGAAVLPPNNAWLVDAENEEAALALARLVLDERYPKQLHTSGAVRAWIAPVIERRWRIRSEHTQLAMVGHRVKTRARGRRATATDLEQLVRYEALYANENESPPRPGLEDRVRSGRVFVLDEPAGGREIVSVAQYGADTHHLTSITDVYTFHPHRGRGHATALVAFVTQRILDSGRAAHLTVAAGNASAVNAYRNVGFETFERAYLAYPEPL